MFAQRAKQTSYKPGIWSQFKRKFLSCLFACVKSTSPGPASGVKITNYTLFSTLVVPASLIIIDMGSDVGVLGSMWSAVHIHMDLLWTTRNMTNPENATIHIGEFDEGRRHSFVRIFTFILMFVMLMVSFLSFLRPNPLASLLRNTQTILHMSSREHERNDVHVPLGKLQFTIYCPQIT